MHGRKHQRKKYKGTANSLLEQNIWNEVFDLDRRKVKPRNYVTGRWVLTINTDGQGNFLKAHARCCTDRFPGQAEGTSADRVSCFHKTRISDELQPSFTDSLIV